VIDRKTAAFAASYLVAGGFGYWVAPKEILDNEAKQSGFLQSDTKRVLSATVDSLRLEAKLLAFSYRGDAKVAVDRSFLWLFGATQELSVPAVVPYYIDLSNLSLADVTFNEKAKIVAVRLPKPVLGDIAFQPEQATTINGGVLSFSQAQVDELSKVNYGNARKAITKQAQGAGFIAIAKQQAKAAVEKYFEIPLRIAGQPDVRVVATFE
jgi:hypothetical protein